MSQTETLPPETPGKRTINIRVTIDTDSLPRDSPGDADNPTVIAQDQGYMVVTGSRQVEDQGTREAAFQAEAGDILHFFASSGSNNFEAAVVIGDIRYAEGDEILTGCSNQTLERTAIAFHSLAEALPARLVQKQFQLYRCVVADNGTGSYDLVFALYDRNEEGQPRLTGHYRWAMQLTAHSNRR